MVIDGRVSRWSQTHLAAGLLLLALALPIAWPVVPPLLDLPGHIGSYHLSLAGKMDPFLRNVYSFHWELIGNLGFDLLVVPFSKLFGLETSVRILTFTIPALTGLGMLVLAKEVHGKIPATAPIALPLCYCYPFNFGFVNYCLGMALAFCFVALSFRVKRTNNYLSWFVFAACFSSIIWLSHAVAWVMAAVMYVGLDIGQRIDREWSSGRWIIPAGLSALPLLSPLILMHLSHNHVPLAMSGWFDARQMVKWVVTLTRDRWIVLDLICLGVIYAVIALATFRRFGLSFNPVLLTCSTFIFILFALAPNAISGSFYVQARIYPYGIALALLAISTAGMSRRAQDIATLAGYGFFAIRMLGIFASLSVFNVSYAEHLKAIDRLPQRASVVAMSPVSCGFDLSRWLNPRLQHMSGLALERRNAFVNDQWTGQGLQLVRVNNAGAWPFVSEPSELVKLKPCTEFREVKLLPERLMEIPRPAFDYVWLLGIPKENRPHLAWLSPVWESQQSALYKIIH